MDHILKSVGNGRHEVAWGAWKQSQIVVTANPMRFICQIVEIHLKLELVDFVVNGTVQQCIAWQGLGVVDGHIALGNKISSQAQAKTTQCVVDEGIFGPEAPLVFRRIRFLSVNQHLIGSFRPASVIFASL
jgi:hypothetical protein